MASISKDQQDTYNLASRMEKCISIRVDDVKAIVASKSHVFEVDARNQDGKTALMYACGRADKKMVEFLLDQGADPNAQCERGNTPMHHAVFDDFCYCVRNGKCRYQHQEVDEGNMFGNTKTRLDIIRLLISRGATLKYNSSGQNPVCVAALHKRPDIVDFFVTKNTRSLKLSDVEVVTALQTLGVATALESLHTYEKDNIIDSYVHFYKAQSIIEEGGRLCLGEGKKSDIASAFSLFSQKEYTCEEWKCVQNDDWAIRNQAFLIAERVIPEDIKEDYLFLRLLFHARICVFQFGNNEDRLSQGTQICKEALQFELTPKLEPTSVLRNLLHGFHMESWQKIQLHDNLKVCFLLMDSCLQVLDKASVCDVHKVHKKVLYNLGSLLLKLALVDCHKTAEIFENLLQFGERVVRVIRKKCEGQTVTSITHFILHKGKALNDCNRRSEKLNRVKRLISKLVQSEDASHLNAEGNTMLHSMMLSFGDAHTQFLKDVALILIRNGCDVGFVNDYGQTVEEILRSRLYDSHPNKRVDCEELIEMLSSRTSVLTLEELAVRAVLRHKISHEGIIPSHLSGIVRGEHVYDLDTDLHTEPSSTNKFRESDVESDPESDVRSSFDEELGLVDSPDSSDFSDLSGNLYSSYESSTDFSDYNGLDRRDTDTPSPESKGGVIWFMKVSPPYIDTDI